MAMYRGMVGYLCLGSSPWLLLINLRHTQLALATSVGKPKAADASVYTLLLHLLRSAGGSADPSLTEQGGATSFGDARAVRPCSALCHHGCVLWPTEWGEPTTLCLGILPSSLLCLRWTEYSSTHFGGV